MESQSICITMEVRPNRKEGTVRLELGNGAKLGPALCASDGGGSPPGARGQLPVPEPVCGSLDRKSNHWANFGHPAAEGVQSLVGWDVHASDK